MNRNKRKSQRGSAILEFALGWTFLWLLFSGVYQYGSSFYTYNRLMTLVANAAELGAKIQYDTGDASAYNTKVLNMVLYGSETAGSSTIVPGLDSSNVSIVVTNDANSIPRDLTVKIVNFQIASFFSPSTINGKPRATNLYYGQVVCASC
jgi:Flp pilus assembly protein TadG